MLNRVTDRLDEVLKGWDLAHLIFSNPLLVALITALLSKPALVGDLFPKLSTVYNLLALVCCVLILFMAIAARKASLMLLAVLALQGFLAIVTVINGGSTGEMIWLLFKVASIYLFIEIGVKVSAKNLALGMAILFTAYLVINLFTVLIFPSGIYYSSKETLNPCYFLGHRNMNFKFLLPGLMMLALYEVSKKGKIGLLSLAYYAGMFLNSILVWSASSLVACASIPVLLAIFLKMRELRKRGGLVSLLVGALGTLAVPILRLQNLFSFIIVNILHKDLSLTARTKVWDSAISTISKAPVFGYGVERDDVMLTRFDGKVISAHNYFLDTAYYGGFVSLILLVISTCLVDKGLRNGSKWASAVIATCLAAAFVLGIAEPYGTGLALLVVIYAAAYNCQGFSEVSVEGDNA